MTLKETISTVEELCEMEETRSERFREELSAFEQREIEELSETRSIIQRERNLLNRLDDLLDEEEEELETLEERSDSLTVEQAMEHGEESLQKVGAHIRTLREFSVSLSSALEIIESNLTSIEKQGTAVNLQDPQPDLQSARDALVAHNSEIEGLEKNLTILNAYLL